MPLAASAAKIVVSGKPAARRQRVVLVAVGLRRVHVLAVGIRRGQQRAEEAVVGGEGLGGGGDEGQVVLRVVADRERVVVARAQEAVHGAAVDLGAPAVPRVVGVVEGAALEVGRQAVGGERLPIVRRVGEPVLAPVGPGQPAQVVVEGPVLHHQHHEGVDGEVARGGQRRAALPARRLRHEHVGRQHRRHARGQARGHRGALQELAPAQVRLGRGAGEALRRFGIALVVHGPTAFYRTARRRVAVAVKMA